MPAPLSLARTVVTALLRICTPLPPLPPRSTCAAATLSHTHTPTARNAIRLRSPPRAPQKLPNVGHPERATSPHPGKSSHRPLRRFQGVVRTDPVVGTLLAFNTAVRLRLSISAVRASWGHGPRVDTSVERHAVMRIRPGCEEPRHRQPRARSSSPILNPESLAALPSSAVPTRDACNAVTSTPPSLARLLHKEGQGCRRR